MEWLEITVCVASSAAEALSDFLVGYTGRGVVLEEGAVTAVKAYLALDNDYEPKLASFQDELEQQKGTLGAVTLSVKTIAEEDWAHNWKAFFKPLRISDRIVVRPSWTDYEARQGDSVLVIDPGMAFGTGTHASTGLCVKALEAVMSNDRLFINRSPLRVLDIGTGTGILGMAAARLGATHVTAIDVDPEAVKTAAENCRLNALEDKVTVSGTRLSDISDHFPLILANITHSELTALCPQVAGLLEDGGIIIVSGILADQADHLLSVYDKEGFSLLSAISEEEWTCMVLTKDRADLLSRGIERKDAGY